MVLAPDTWPLTYLHVKPIVTDGSTLIQFGTIRSNVRPDHIVIHGMDGSKLATYNSIDELVEANWTVD
jgi:hypothetical protein